MKIAHIIATFPPYHGGMGYICYHNARVLAERGHAVTVFTLDHARLPYHGDPAASSVVRLKTPLMHGDAGMVPQLYRLLKDFDIIHVHYPFFGGAEYAYLAAMLRKKPYFLTYHMDVYGNTLLKKAVIAGYEPLLLKRIVRNAAGICAPSLDYLKSTKAGSCFLRDRLTSVIYGGVDTEKFRPRPKDPALTAAHGLAGKIVALFVGNLIPFKGLHLILDALARIDQPDWVLLVVGGGYHEAEYRRMAVQKGLDRRVIFAGPQSPDGKLPDYYNLADFFILPSTHSESFGLVILEAMASGKPAVVSALPGPAGLVRHGETGFVVRIGDVDDLKGKMIRLFSSPAERGKMGAAACNAVRTAYRWENIGAQLEAAYRRIV